MRKTKELYDRWNEKKKEVEFSSDSTKSVRIGEVWWYYEGMNIGNEISKDGAFRRPCIILQTRTGNGLLLVIPLTSKYHAWMQQRYVEIYAYNDVQLSKKSRAIVNQATLIDKKRLVHKKSERRVGRNTIRFIKKRIIKMLYI